LCGRQPDARLQVDLLALLFKCMGVERNGFCSTDHHNGKVRKVACCSGSCKPLDVDRIITKKTCARCSLDAIDAVLTVPENGVLQPGSTQNVDGVEVRVAALDGG
jgi:hypothetical protein